VRLLNQTGKTFTFNNLLSGERLACDGDTLDVTVPAGVFVIVEAGVRHAE